MRCAICGVSQEKIISLDLDVSDILILNWLHDFFLICEKVRINDEVLGCLKYQHLCDEMPLLKIGKKRLGVRLKKLAEKGLIAHYCYRGNDGTNVYYRMLEGYHYIRREMYSV